MYKNNQGIVHLFLIVVIVLVGIGGLLYYSWQKGLIKTTPTQEVLPTPEITEWETYRSDVLNLEYKLPQEFNDKITESLVKGGDGGQVVCITENSQQKDPCILGTVGISAISKDYACGCGGDFSMNRGYIEKEGRFFSKDGKSYIAEFVNEITNPNGIKILKIKGQNLNTHNSMYPPEGKIGAVVNTENQNYPAIVLQMNLNENANLNEELFNQILSTFKFTN